MKHAITFIDGVERNRLNPRTFRIPSEKQKDRINLGDMVKIGSEFSDGAERFWVSVLSIKDNGTMTGTVSNYLLTAHLDFDDVVKFERKHILST